VGGKQADLFIKFPVHGFDGYLTSIYATLRELPFVVSDTLPEEDLVAGVDEHNAHVRAKALTVNHRITGITAGRATRNFLTATIIVRANTAAARGVCAEGWGACTKGSYRPGWAHAMQ